MKMASDDDTRAAVTLNDLLCTCVENLLGLDFVLTAGCIVHDRCVCNQPQRQELGPGVEFVTWGPSAPGGDCLWCASYVALLKSIASLDEVTRERLRRAYLDARAL